MCFVAALLLRPLLVLVLLLAMHESDAAAVDLDETKLFAGLTSGVAYNVPGSLNIDAKRSELTIDGGAQGIS